MKELIKNIFLLHRLTHVQLYNPFASYSSTWRHVTPRHHLSHMSIHTSTYTIHAHKYINIYIHMRKKSSHVNTHKSTQLHPHPNTHTHTQSHMTTHVTQTDLRVRHYSPNPSTSLPLLTHPPWSQLVVSLMQIVGFWFRSICFSIISINIYI